MTVRLQKSTALIFLLAVGVCLDARGQAEEKKKYEFAEPSTDFVIGNIHLRRGAESYAAIAFDKRYDELSIEDKARLRSWYPNLGESDEPPYPLNGMGAIAKDIGRLQNAVLMKGAVWLDVRIDEKGMAQSVSVFKTPDEKFSRAVAVILMKARYKPAKCDGKPCAMDFRLAYDFRVVGE